jgi:PLP dependent protein
MPAISENLKGILSGIPPQVKLVAISKTHPAEVVMKAYHAGQRVFGENKVQEMLEKKEHLPHDIEWHLVGHLQTNKVKFIVPFVHLIHAVDSLKLLNEIEKEASKIDRVVSVLIQIHIATEETKFGLSYEEARQILLSDEVKNFNHVCVKGLMGMATLTEDEQTIRNEFRKLNDFFLEMKKSFPSVNTLSMGMTSDYKIAVEEGSNMVRIGSAIFGERS